MPSSGAVPAAQEASPGPAEGEPTRLWTVQPVGFWEAAKEEGVLRCDGRRIGFQDPAEREAFWFPYRWMKRQMAERIPGYGGRYPIWCYVKKPDLRSTAFGRGGDRLVRVGFEAPEEGVLVSDLALWHVPLNNGFLARTRAEDEAFDAEEEARLGTTRTRLLIGSRWWDPAEPGGYPEDLRERVLDSWGRIFPDRWHELEDEGLWGPIRPVAERAWHELQACVEEVPVGRVAEVREFTARYAEYERDSAKKRVWERSIERARERYAGAERNRSDDARALKRPRI